MLPLKIVFWTSLVLLVWTHVGYPLAAGLAARLRRRRVESSAIEPTVSVVIAAHNEEDVIERRVRNLLDLDYPADRLEILVASDASIDGTDEIVDRLAVEDGRVKLVRCARAGKEKRPVEALATNNMPAVSFRISGNSWRVRSGFGLYFFPGLCVPIKHQAARKYTPRSPRERQHRPRVWRIANA